MVEGSIGRLLPGRLQPAEIARRLEREMMVHQVVGLEGPIAPNAFVVVVHPADATQLEGYRERLTEDLSGWLTTLAGERGLTLVGPVSVAIEHDPRVPRRTVRISAAMVASSSDEASGTFAEPEDRSVVYALEIARRHVFARSTLLRDGFTIVGRAPASDIVLEDPSVSRFHARIEVNGRRIDVRDLDSTNGTWINGRSIGASPLEAGDLITFGSIEARIVISPGPAGQR